MSLVLTNLFVAIVTDAYMLANVETSRKKGGPAPPLPLPLPLTPTLNPTPNQVREL